MYKMAVLVKTKNVATTMATFQIFQIVNASTEFKTNIEKTFKSSRCIKASFCISKMT